jgi:hypothetical protein
MLFLPPTLISIIEVILVLVPALLSVAYVTVAERKTMASMQRRLGPNAVGQLKFNTSFKRSYLNNYRIDIINNNILKGSFTREGTIIRKFYSSLSSAANKIINELYLNRKAPIKPFEEKIVSVCKDLLSSTALNTFFKDLKGNKPLIVYNT